MLMSIDRPIHFVMADPPWTYTQRGVEGAAERSYGVMTLELIVADLTVAYDQCIDNCYLALWVTFPILAEWFEASHKMPWSYVSGATWGKTNGLGIGFHFRGDAELCLLYRKGAPKPKKVASNLWLASRGRHSVKPALALLHLVEMATDKNDTVLDLYAGESASLALACKRMERNYVGAEADESRHRSAIEVLSQGDLFFGT